jgi:hypothetical protein
MADASAERTVALEEAPPISKRTCEMCGSVVNAAARTCKDCKAYKDGKDCKVCGKWIPKGAIDCPECKGAQAWLRRFVSLDAAFLGMLAGLISVIGSVAPGIIRMINYGSQTTAYVLRAERDPKISDQKDVLVIRVQNSGGQPSIITSASLNLKEAGGDIVPLVVSGDLHVPPNGASDVKLFASDDAFSVPPDSRAKIIDQLCSQSAIVELKVEEKSRFGKKVPNQRVPMAIDVTTIRSWAAQRLIPTRPELCP